jgi:hypothetical protein
MTALVVAETVLLVLLTLLVAGLLRSHAEIMRRLGPPGADPLPPSTAAPVRATGTAVPDIAGLTPFGDAVSLSLRPGSPSTLLAFLTSGCETCGEFWTAFRAGVPETLPAGTRLAIVTRGERRESPSRLRGLAPGDVAVVMSDEAWEAYAVPGTPYFIFVDGPSGEVRGEGAATGWPQLASLLRDALADASAGADRAARADATLAAAGVGPGHASLHPTRSP